MSECIIIHQWVVGVMFAVLFMVGACVTSTAWRKNDDGWFLIGAAMVSTGFAVAIHLLRPYIVQAIPCIRLVI